VGLFAYQLTAGASALIVHRWLSRLPYVAGMCGALALSATGFGLLAYAHSLPLLIVLLLVAGLGVSVHLLLLRVLVAEVNSGDTARNRAYSILQIALNIAGSVGPFVASYLYATGDSRALLGMVAGCHLLAALVLLFTLPRRVRPQPAPNRWPISRNALATILANPVTLRIVAVSAVGSFVYAQFYSAFALFVAYDVASPLMRAILLAGPAVAIALLQHPVSAVVARLIGRGVQPLAVLAGATAVFGVSLFPLGSGLPVVGGCLVAIAYFSVAEMVFTPMVSTAFAGLPTGSRLEAMSLRQLCWTIGVAAGSLCGGSLFLLLRDAGAGRWYWLSLGAITVASVALLVRGQVSAQAVPDADA
jgi:MFS family permease